MSFLPYLVSYLVPITVVLGYRIGGFGTFLTALFCFGLIPIADLVIGRDPKNPTPEEERWLENSMPFRMVLVIYAIIQWALLAWAISIFSSSEPSLVERVGLILSVGIANGAIGITVAHELIHRRNWWLKKLGESLLLTVCYLHFAIEHVKGHHVRVATEADPATARRGESIYRFLPRSLAGSYQSAWSLEAKRLANLGSPVWSSDNKMLWYTICPLFLTASLAAAFGGLAVIFFLLQSFVAFTLLEIVNYLEHYGLQRREITPGRYEKVGLQHAWDSDYRLSNLLLFKLQRHADHHARPTRSYQVLATHKSSPQLPYGYPLMTMLALLPPVWRKLMDGRIPKFNSEASGPLAPPGAAV